MGEGKVAITAVTRLGLTLAGGEGETPLGEAWGGNEVILPPETTNQQLRNVMTGETLRVSREHTLPVAQLFRQFPVALLVNS